MHSLCFFSQKADRYPASILCVPSICMRTLSLTGCDVLTYNDWEDNFFFLSIRLCPSPPVVISAEGGLLSPTMLSLSVSLSLSPHAHLIPAHWKKCVCVCVFTYSCCSATSSAFFAPSIFVLYQSCVFFSQISVTPSTPPSSFPFSLPLSTSPQKREKKYPIPLVAMGSGCHAAARFSHGPRACVCVYCSVTESGCHVDGEEGERCGVRMWGFKTGRCHLVGPKYLTHIPADTDTHTHTHTHTHPRGRKAIDHVMQYQAWSVDIHPAYVSKPLEDTLTHSTIILRLVNEALSLTIGFWVGCVEKAKLGITETYIDGESLKRGETDEGRERKKKKRECYWPEAEIDRQPVGIRQWIRLSWLLIGQPRPSESSFFFFYTVWLDEKESLGGFFGRADWLIKMYQAAHSADDWMACVWFSRSHGGGDITWWWTAVNETSTQSM